MASEPKETKAEELTVLAANSFTHEDKGVDKNSLYERRESRTLPAVDCAIQSDGFNKNI